MVWTIVPALILIYVSLYSKKVWEEYRYGRPGATGEPARILVIAQQFQWNVIYAGPNGKLGKYLVYPKPTDRLWPRDAAGQPFTFTYDKYEDTNGPADMPYADAVLAINSYIEQENPLGKVFDDPDGRDDNFENQPGRPMYIPKGRPIELQLTSKDVVHDFFLPNFRVRLDAVPGLRGVLYFDSTITSEEREDRAEMQLTFKGVDELTAAMKQPDHPENAQLLMRVDETSKPRAADAKSAGAFQVPGTKRWRYNDKDGKAIFADREVIVPAKLAALKGINPGELRVSRPGYFDLVCGELCGSGHYTMKGQVVAVTDKEYAEKFEKAKPAAAAKDADDQ
jgi:heme/copper-type cytochrome/quinol oxidase subunit 2